MSELLIDMAYGRCCMVCGDYFSKPESKGTEIHEHGHEAACKKCWGELTPTEQEYHKLADVDTIENKIMHEGAKRTLAEHKTNK